RSFFHATWRVALHTLDVITTGRGQQLVNGPALIARMAKSADDKGVELLVNTPATRLVSDGGRVTGAVLATVDGERTVRARCGVVLAAGGFPHDERRIERLYPRIGAGHQHYALPPPETTGDGLNLAESVGGVIDEKL